MTLIICSYLLWLDVWHIYDQGVHIDEPKCIAVPLQGGDALDDKN